MLRNLLVFCVLLSIRAYARLFYRHEQEWVNEEPLDDRWPPYRIVAILNHTSLFEFLLAGQVPTRFLWRMASHCTVPIADITIQRPVIGLFWRLVAANVVPISRERDRTWEEVLASVDDPEAMIIILPEGRMKRRGGLDKHGKPLTVRGGIADLIRVSPEGKMLLAYNQGLHHIQAPGEGRPRFFQPVRLRLEQIDIGPYRARLLEGLDSDQMSRFRKRVVADLTARRDRYCTSDHGGTDGPESEWRGAEHPRAFY
ncbi:MAG: hypothetical protein AAGC60_28285 [Acidobacteriota bacterium]